MGTESFYQRYTVSNVVTNKRRKKIINGRVKLENNDTYVELGMSYTLIENIYKRTSINEKKIIF